jgi:hypothetical protein
MARLTNKKAQNIQRAAEAGGRRKSMVSGAGAAVPSAKLDKRKMRARKGQPMQGPLMKGAQKAFDKLNTAKQRTKFRNASVKGKSVKKAKAAAAGGE